MNITPKDWRKLGLSLALCLGFCLAGATLVLLSLDRHKQARAQQASAQTQRNQALGKLKQVSEEESEIKLKSALYSNLAARGMVGEEQRLEWVELLRSIKDNRRLLDIQYEFAPQQPLGNSPGAWGFYASTMKLQLQLLHEEDLLNVLADLRNTAKALVLVRSCEVSRQPRMVAEPTALHPNLQAQCTLDWVTLRGPAPR